MSDKQKKICVLGHFGIGENLLNGQTIKTKIMTNELCRIFGENRIIKLDTHGGRKTVFKAPFQVITALKNSKNTIIFPAHNGVIVYVPLLAMLRHIFKGCKLHYAVIGGWLPEFLQSKKHLAEMLKSFEGIYVETNTMKQALEKQGFSNIYILPNCKKFSILNKNDLVYPKKPPYKLCTFSRVTKEKGIETAVNIVKNVNRNLGYTAYTLDIYGQVDKNQKRWFKKLKSTFPDYIKYGGFVPYDKSEQVLKNYFALLFPTQFYTEGIPGTIIDAYAAGLPVISAKWANYDDVIDEGKTGLGYTFNDEKQFYNLLLDIANNPQSFLDMKYNCLKKAAEYISSNAIKALSDRIK